ncbi:MAG: group II intron reverse transcriptase/maturase [Symploca sp. SIO2B6]|nr:group II intron reverse transcriptase/maturase [Symploca sp. SIO2B6]
MDKSKTHKQVTVEWNGINWRKAERYVFKLQKRIYRASSRGDVKAVRRLQKTMMRSWYAKCLAVRRVTQDNQGKKTAGVDGQKSYTPSQRLKLVENLELSRKASPLRRVWIPKPGTSEKRGLGIPTLYDRALQALVKQTLEPEWEAKFEPNNYGFRPGRSCHDAIEAIFKAIRYKAKYVLDADIAKCFDRINHEALLEKLNTFPTIRRQIRAWLKAGVMDDMVHHKTSEGTPQGGVISPLLANIALHGLEKRINQVFPKLEKHQRETWFHKKGESFNTPSIIRYADDFVIMHENLAIVQKCQQITAEWLKGMGLELKPSKTRISHTLKKHEGKTGFDFLGFNIRQYPVAEEYLAKDTRGKILGFKTLIKSSKEAIKRHVEKLGKIINAHKSAPQQVLIGNLNPTIRGWANYHSTQVNKKTFSRIDHIVYQQLLAWAKYTHPGTPVKEIVDKCWQTVGNDRWIFGVKQGGKITCTLHKHAKTKIVRHTKVAGNKSPFDGDLVYWSSRMAKHPECPKELARLLREQKGKCPWCGLHFRNDDKIEVDHRIAKRYGGKDSKDNRQALHKHCHDKKTASDELIYQKQLAYEELVRDLDDNPF